MNIDTAFVEAAGVEDRFESNGNILVEEVELDEPKADDVLIDLKATGVCHSDWHVANGDAPHDHYPCALGHEGAGVVERVGDSVGHVEPGDHVVLSYIPSCGKCEYCAQGYQELCVRGRHLEKGHQMDGDFRLHQGDTDIGQAVLLGCFSEATVVHKDAVIPIPEEIPFEAACLTGCGVATGFGAAANRADINAGDTVVHFGFGGVGANAVQGSVAQGADEVIVVEPKDQRREWAREFGATHTIDPEAEDPAAVVRDLTNGAMADTAIVTVDVLLPERTGEALATIGGRGEVVLVSVAPGDEDDHIDMAGGSVGSIVGLEKEIKGTIYGGWSPNYAVPHLLEMYRNGSLKLDELVTRTYELDEINQAFDDMLQGNNIRGVVTL